MDLLERIEAARIRFESREPSIRAFLPEPERFERLRTEARLLCDRYPDAGARPPLFGLLVGVKDLFHVEGFLTRAGSRLPTGVLQGTEADTVSRLKRAGALILGKTVTTEFAHFTPGPTRNPHNTDHTPGGSSSGSAAAVAADLCDLALGTQTIGSIIRPAAFCGVVGLKPTAGRVSASGVIPLAPSLDQVGWFAHDVQTTRRAARVLCGDWHDAGTHLPRPVLGIPDGPYLERAPDSTAAWFTDVARALTVAGYEVRRVPLMADFADVCARHYLILAAEAARVHRAWYDEFAVLYGMKVKELIERGRSISSDALASALAARARFRAELRQAQVEARIDVWISPASLGPAPRGLESTGDPVMNLPWTHAGLPAITVPAGRQNGLPMGLQIAGGWNHDESLVAWAEQMEAVTSPM